MEALITVAERLLSSQSIVQVFVGGCTFLLIGYMVIRARGDREHIPAPAPATISDVPGPFFHGPREVLDLIREQRDMDRRRTEDTGRIAECLRTIKDEAKRQTELLAEIAEDQRVEHRVNAERRHSP